MPQTVALAVDGMEPSLLNTWIDAGELPNFAAVRREGTYGHAKCSSLSSAEQWTTHFTGVHPDTHGVTGFLKADRKRRAGEPAPDARELINLSDIRVKTYPELLAEAGQRVGLLNPLPLWPPLELDGGFCISGMLTPPTSDRWVHPPELEAELDAVDYEIDIRYGKRPYGFVDDDLFGEVSLETLYEDMFDVLEARIEFAKRSVTDHETDFLYILFKSIDVIQHCFWVHMENGNDTYGDAILDSYKLVDEYIGWLREQEETNLLLFSDHGFGPRLADHSSFITSIASAIDERVTIPDSLVAVYNAILRSPIETEDDDTSVTATTGTHENPAAWALCGPDVEALGRDDIRFEDVTATIMALLGRPIPEAYIGEPVDAVSADWHVEPVSLETRRDVAVENDEVISERLHNLGYAEMVDE